MQSLLGPTKLGRLSSLAAIRHYSPSPIFLQPTVLHRAEAASDLKKHPESTARQEKLKDVKHDHHWTEQDSTASEADVKADRDDIAEELKSKKVQDEVATYGERGFG